MTSIWLLLVFAFVVSGKEVIITTDSPSIYHTQSTNSIENEPSKFTELRGGQISDKQILNKTASPFLLREDLFIERDGELVVPPGVEIRFAPMIGITVRGIITAEGKPKSPILLTSVETPLGQPEVRSIRLVDGPSPLEGRLQILHRGTWRSVCTNSRDWTRADYETACRELGFQGGRWSGWVDRLWPATPRLLYEEPRCRGTETSLQNCEQWSNRQLGAGVCDYHPDLSISCLPRHDGATQATKHWRGIRFEGALYDRPLIQENTFYIKRSKSILRHVSIKYAGSGRDFNVTSALHVEGVPPQMESISVSNSVFNAINITSPDAPININNCKIHNNLGYGIYVNSSTGLALIENCVVRNNGADGIKYVHHDERPDDEHDRADIHDLCFLPSTTSQTFPITIFMEQNKYSLNSRKCPQKIFARSGHVLTLQFLQMKTDRNDSATIEVYDGTSSNDKLLARVSVRNGTLPQSVTTSRHQLYIEYNAQPRTQMIAFLRVSSGYMKKYDLNVTNSKITFNNGRGIAAENLRSSVHIHKTNVTKSNHIAGIHVLRGAADVNITSSKIESNIVTGINITMTGGSRNISRSIISLNKEYGMAVWLNDSSSTEYIHFNQSTIVEYSEISKNEDIGILIGNSTGISYVNITGNIFSNNPETAVQVESSWRNNAENLKLQIGHNDFIENSKLGIKLSPVLNIEGKIEYNHFIGHVYGCILIRNPLYEEFNILPADLLIQRNHFYKNHGIFVVSIGLSPYSNDQHLLFTKNYLQDNKIKEPFDSDDSHGSKLLPRSRVAAVLVVSSSNVDVYRNILDNPLSRYEIGSHLEDQSKTINCTYNWLGSEEEKIILESLFHRKDRYNLAKINYMPYLLHSTDPSTNSTRSEQTFVPKFKKRGDKNVGGEVEGLEILQAGEYDVERDINIRPGGKLIIQPGVTLRFPPAVGMMVAGVLEARGKRSENIKLTLKEEEIPEMKQEINDTSVDDDNKMVENETITSMLSLIEENNKVRLRGNKSSEGRLQVFINGKWGTVCNYGWTIHDAALVCHQLGLVLDPDNWNLERSVMPDAGINEDIILSNVRCTEDDTDILHCKAESAEEFENSCTHENDVGVRCSEAGWAGLRLGPLAERSDLQFITIERAGLLDYTTNSFKPALQIDFVRHSLENMRIINNLQDGLGVLYSDIFSNNAINTVQNSIFSDNGGSGISFKQLGLRISNSLIENNKLAGIRHNPALSAVQQREFAGWFMHSVRSDGEDGYKPIIIPKMHDNIDLITGEIKYILTEKDDREDLKKTIQIRCTPGYVIGIQLLNPIENRSTEQIIIYDAQRIISNSNIWHVKRDLSIFPVSSSSFTVILEYYSGKNALGGAVLVLTTLQAPIQNIKNRIVKGPIPTLTLTNTKIRRNRKGILASYYNRYLDELGEHYLRKSNESIRLINCEISYNREEAIHIHSPLWNIYTSNISEISIHVNNTLITDNGQGISQFSRDMRNSNNLFHWILQDSTIERNEKGGFDISLPYVWQYNENFTHSLYFDNNTWRNNKEFGFLIDGHYASFNMSYNRFDSNQCKHGLISIRGMEKKMEINNNRIERNSGTFMVEFKADSQSEIFGEIAAKFHLNEIRNNYHGNIIRRENNQMFNTPTYVVGFHGIQKVKVKRNLFGDNSLDYVLLAGIKTAKINNEVDVSENWWGTSDEGRIKEKIFDFDDWNDHAVAKFRPYLLFDSLKSENSSSQGIRNSVNLNNLGGRIEENLWIPYRFEPYIVRSDITIMPEATVNIEPGVIMEFAPNVGILVLGTLKAIGDIGSEIVMRPMNRDDTMLPKPITKRATDNEPIETIRFCKQGKCSPTTNEGFIELFNRTTLQWIPLCDTRFTERNAQVACRQLGFDHLNVYVSHDKKYELHPGSLTKIWSWPEPFQCSGSEKKLEECPIRLNGQLYGHKYDCPWDGKFVFVHCGRKNIDNSKDYWGGIRIANGEFEHHLYEHRIHDVLTHETVRRVESVLKHINITGAGILHYQKSAAIQSVMKSPEISYVKINQSAYHGINIVSPTHTVQLLFNIIENVLGNGVNVLSLTGEGREADESSFAPLKELSIPYNLFSMVDICDTTKEINVEERVLIYYKYDNNPVNCVKIFRSMYRAKPFGFRLLQFNLFNSTGKPGRADGITLYDGDIYNVTAATIGHLEFDSRQEKKLFKTEGPSLSVRLFANGASGIYGFIAEVVTLPISAIGFNRDVQHNISYSIMTECQEGAIKYLSAGEVNAIMTSEKNQFINNCEKLYGNFSTCKAAVSLDVQNTQSLYFRNNLFRGNQGGLSIRADSRGSATSLKGWIHHNLFVENMNKPTLYVEGRQSSPYQEVTIFRNYFVNNDAPYDSNIILKQVVSNMTLNYLHANLGLHLLEISGFERVRLPIYQSTSHNGFYNNYAIDRLGRSTIVAGTPGQQYVDNVFFNPDNDYEILTVNRSLVINMELFANQLEMWRSHVDARHNWWGYNETIAVAGRIRDRGDSPELLQVDYQPFHMNNKSVLNGKCPPAWDLVGETCYIFIGAPMDYYSARDFCQEANASMPFIKTNASVPFITGEYPHLWEFLQKQQHNILYSDRIWVQELSRINQCTAFTYQKVVIDDCRQPSPFVCEIDPRPFINPSWTADFLALGVISASLVALAFLAASIGFWISKSKRRKVERLERRNSIRQSLHSLRSIGSTSGFTELAYRRKPLPTKSTDTLASRSMDYKKMMNGGSIDSMDKSQLNSSLEDNRSYDVYEAHNPRYSPSTSDFKGATQKYPVPHVDNPVFDLAYRNEGFRNHSTFTSRNNSNWASIANSEVAPDDSPTDNNDDSAYLNHASTLPLNSSLAMTDSITELKRDIEAVPYSPIEYGQYDRSPTTPISEPVPGYFSPPLPPQPYYYDERPRSGNLLETNLDVGEEKPLRSKSEALLETNFDVFLPNEPTELTQLSADSRSKSQPLETAM